MRRFWMTIVILVTTMILGMLGPLRTPPAEPATPDPKNVQIVVIRQTSHVTDADVKRTITAVQKQLDHDFTPVWGIRATLKIATTVSDAMGDNTYLILIQDTDYRPAPMLGIGGFHDNNLFPFAIIYADPKGNEDWSSTFSHEVLEMLVDPDADKMVAYHDKGKVLYVDFEICDPVETYGYRIDGVIVADFVYPQWFREGSEGPYDFLQQIHSPFTTTKDSGYVGTQKLVQP